MKPGDAIPYHGEQVEVIRIIPWQNGRQKVIVRMPDGRNLPIERAYLEDPVNHTAATPAGPGISEAGPIPSGVSPLRP